MNDKTSGRRGRRGRPRRAGRARAGRARAGRARAGVLAAVLAGIAVLAAACGGSSAGSSAAGGPTTYQQALAYARCMRSHGEPSWPDPSSQGVFSTSGINLNSPLLASASNSCQSLRPARGVHLQLSAAQQQALLKQGLKYSACMRAHGIPRFPDPEVQGAKQGGLGFSTNGLVAPGQSLSSWPRFPAASKACEPQLGGGS